MITTQREKRREERRKEAVKQAQKFFQEHPKKYIELMYTTKLSATFHVINEAVEQLNEAVDKLDDLIKNSWVDLDF